MKISSLKNKFKQAKAEIKNHKIAFAVYVILRTIVIISMVLSFVRGDWENLFVCSLALILFMAPAFVSTNFGIEIPGPLEIIILLFIFAANILGEMQSYYIRYPLWDTMLHTINGFLCAAIGFSMVDILNENKSDKFKLSPMYLSIAAFCFSMTIGVLWEFFEFGCDYFLKTDMQKDFVVNAIHSVKLNPMNVNKTAVVDNIRSTVVDGVKLPLDGYLDIGLFDTMKDLFVNFIGAVVFSILGYIYIKTRGKNKFASYFIPRKVRLDKSAQTDENGEEF